MHIYIYLFFSPSCGGLQDPSLAGAIEVVSSKLGLSSFVTDSIGFS